MPTLDNTILSVRGDVLNPASTANTPKSFLGLPSELRNEIYTLLLVRQEPIMPWPGFNPPEDHFAPRLLRTNKVIHREASSLFYGKNCFDFSAGAREKIVAFLDQIGGTNAGYIRHIVIQFPTFLFLDHGDVSLEDSSVGILVNLESRCASLSTLQTCLHSTNAMELRLDDLDYPKVAAEVLRLVNNRFRAISSLQEIILEVYEDAPSENIRREMKALGWTIYTTVEDHDEEEGWDRRLGDSDDDEHDYDYYSYSDDYGEHDFDSDSDFWRRAAE